jgi:hypothetical protein
VAVTIGITNDPRPITEPLKLHLGDLHGL